MKKELNRDDYYNDNYIDTEECSEYENDISEPVFSDKAKRQTSPKRKRRKSSIFTKIIAIILAAVLVFLAVSWVLSLFVPTNTNILIMATDEDGTRTDTLMLASFNKKNKSLDFLSVPRDTYVTVSDESYALMCGEYPQPNGKNMKINAVHHYGGEQYGTELIKSEVENLLGIKLDYYVKVDFDAFRYIIDSVGGIDFYVPCDMKYTDPLQNLNIDLKEGQQLLNGEQAEHLLRFRSGYANADIGRISVQQDFMKAFISQTLSKGGILTHPSVYINAMFKYDYVDTDFGFFDLMSYLLLVGGIDINSVSAETLPGTAAMRGGQSVYIPKLSEISEFLSKINSN